MSHWDTLCYIIGYASSNSAVMKASFTCCQLKYTDSNLHTYSKNIYVKISLNMFECSVLVTDRFRVREHPLGEKTGRSAYGRHVGWSMTGSSAGAGGRNTLSDWTEPLYEEGWVFVLNLIFLTNKKYEIILKKIIH